MVLQLINSRILLFIMQAIRIKIVPKETSRLYQYAKNSEAMEKWVLENYDKIKNGEVYNNAITFPRNRVLTTEGRSLYNTIHNANMHNMKVNSDGSISGRMKDPYNFEKWILKNYKDAKNLKDVASAFAYNKIARVNNRAYKQQSAGKLEPFYIDMPINISNNDYQRIKQKYSESIYKKF